jgi:hypothetical protein
MLENPFLEEIMKLVPRLPVVVLSLLIASPVAAQVFPSPVIAEDMSFTDALGGTTMTLTFDGTDYWSSSGGGTGGVRYAQYNAAGALLNTYSPGIDFRSVYTLGGTVYAREFANMSLFQQTSPGSFTPGVVVLAGSIDGQSAVVPNGTGTELIALSSGSVYRWDLSGASLGSVPLIGYGTQNSEGDYPQNRGVAGAGSHWFTYSNGVVSAWDAAGNRVEQATLTGAGTSFDSHFSFSYANGRFWINDSPGGAWRGFPFDAAPLLLANIPTLGDTGIILLALAIAAAGLIAIRSRTF